MKLIHLTTAIALILTPSIALAHGTTSTSNTSLPHLTAATAVPRNSRVPLATYKIGVHLSTDSFSQLTIERPEQIHFSGRTLVTAQSGERLAHSTQIKGQSIQLTFEQPVPPDSVISIQLFSVRAPRPGNRVWLFPVSVQGGNLKAPISLGMARVHTYQ